MTHISWREVPLLIRCVPAAAKMPRVRLRCLLFNCLPSCSFRICLKCTDEAMDEILYCYEMWQCNDQIHAIEVWNHCILNWIQIEMDIFCPCRSDVFVVVLLHIHPPWSHHSHHLGSILCISQLHPPAAYIAGLVLFRFYGPMFCCLFVLGSFL